MERAEPAAEEEDRRRGTLTRIMFAYSARKNSANCEPEYSTCEAGDDFRFAFHDVERRAVGFGDTRDEIDDEQRQQRPHEPLEHARVARLRHDDVRQVQAAGGDQHADQREAHRDFVGHDLRRGAHRAEERVLRVRRPAREDDPVHAERGHRQQVQQARVGVRQHELRVERHHRPRGECRHERDQRREAVQERLRHGGLHHFLEQQLEHVGEGLEDALAHVHRPVAHVHPADQLAFPHHVERDGEDHRHGDQQDLQHDPRQQAERRRRRRANRGRRSTYIMRG